MMSRLSLTISMLLLTASVGLVVWAVSDNYQHRALNDIFYVKLTDRFKDEATEQRIRFDRHVKAYYPAVRTYAQLSNARDYIEKESENWDSEQAVVDYKDTPKWLPKLSMMRRFIMPRYALLLDVDGAVRELYRYKNPMLPTPLLHISEDLLDNSYQQSYLGEVEGKLYIMSSSFIGEEDESPRLLILSPVDEEFLLESQGVSSNKNIALLNNDDMSVIISSDHENIPSGATMDQLEGKYLSTVAGHLGSGSSDLLVQFASFVSTADVEEQTREILAKDRQIRAITAIAYFLAFALVMYWVTSRIQRLTKRVVEFSTAMEIQQPDFKTHDELLELEGRFELMANAVQTETKALEHQALHDPLTDLPNRKLLNDRVKLELMKSEFKENKFILMLTDLDRFKEINDTLGHHIGDEVLKEAGDRLISSLRNNDTVARLGGDEFGMLLPSTSVEFSFKIAQKIVEKFNEPFIIEGQSLNIGISIGVVEFPLHGDDQTVLMQRADVAMYHAKQNKLGYSVYKAEEDQNTLSRLALMTDFRDALENDELFLFYQPKMDVRSRKIISAEALLRWKHPTRGYVSPEEFVPLAEQTGLILPLTIWVLKRATAEWKKWEELGYNVSLAINMSVYCLQFTDLAGTIDEILKNSGVPANRCVLELTESIFMKDADRAKKILNQLDEMGFELSIDDFGTGYSSLAYLKQLPVDELKIDKSFVMDMMENENDAAIVKATIELAHAMGMRVVAEGVETELTLLRLEKLGADIVQGFLIAKPMSSNDLASMLGAIELNDFKYDLKSL